VTGDAVLLERLAQNLVDNAISYNLDCASPERLGSPDDGLVLRLCRRAKIGDV
jgi:hypothetical protein